jgi:hypothetical protein
MSEDGLRLPSQTAVSSVMSDSAMGEENKRLKEEI